MDPVHNEYLHGYFNNYILERMGVLADRGRLGQRQFTPGPDAGRHWRRGAKVTHHVKVGFTQFEHGVLKHRLMEDEDEATSPGWTVGHPVVIPNLEHGSRGRGFQIRVPMDDTHTYYLYYNEHDPLPGENTDQAPEDIPVFKVPLPGVDADGLPIWELLDDASGQDNFAWTSQGPLMERWLERLGPSDVGILMYRRLLGEQMRIVEDGGDPMNVFRDPEKNQPHRIALRRPGSECNPPGVAVRATGPDDHRRAWEVRHRRVGARSRRRQAPPGGDAATGARHRRRVAGVGVPASFLTGVGFRRGSQSCSQSSPASRPKAEPIVDRREREVVPCQPGNSGTNGSFGSASSVSAARRSACSPSSPRPRVSR